MSRPLGTGSTQRAIVPLLPAPAYRLCRLNGLSANQVACALNHLRATGRVERDRSTRPPTWRATNEAARRRQNAPGHDQTSREET